MSINYSLQQYFPKDCPGPWQHWLCLCRHPLLVKSCWGLGLEKDRSQHSKSARPDAIKGYSRSATAFSAFKEVFGCLGFPGHDSSGSKREMELQCKTEPSSPQIQPCPRQCSKIVPVLVEESGCAPAEGGLPTALPGAGVVLVLAVVQRGGRAACCGSSDSSFCNWGREAAEVVQCAKLLTFQCNPCAGYSLRIMKVLESKLLPLCSWANPDVHLWVTQFRPSRCHFVTVCIHWHNGSLPERPLPLQNTNVQSWSWMEKGNSHGNSDKYQQMGHKQGTNKWLNLSCDHLIKVNCYGMLPGCLSYKACTWGHHGAESREAKAEDGAGSAR